MAYKGGAILLAGWEPGAGGYLVSMMPGCACQKVNDIKLATRNNRHIILYELSLESS